MPLHGFRQPGNRRRRIAFAQPRQEDQSICFRDRNQTLQQILVLVTLRLQCFVLAPYCDYGCRVGVGDVHTWMAVALTRRACWTNAITSGSALALTADTRVAARTWSSFHGICYLPSMTIRQPVSQEQEMTVWNSQATAICARLAFFGSDESEGVDSSMVTLESHGTSDGRCCG
jgi:hypothetical protein